MGFNFVVRESKAKDEQVLSKLRGSKQNAGYSQIANAISLAKTKLAGHKDDYELLSDKSEIELYFSYIEEAGIAAIDTETDSLDPITTTLAGVCLYTPGRKACYIPLNHISHITKEKLSNQADSEFVADLLRKTKVKWVYHNAKFDYRVIKNQLGVNMDIYWDTQIGASLLNENESHRLKDLYFEYINQDDGEILTFDKLFSGVSFTEVPPSVGYLYAAGDAVKTFELYEFQKKYLNDSGKLKDVYKLFRDTEMPLIKVLADMEDTGINFDTEYCNSLLAKYEVKQQEALDNLNAEASKYTSEEINWKSPLQLAKLFYDVMKVKPVDRDKPRGTGDDILEKMDNPVSNALREYRAVSKLIDAFLVALPQQINKATGKIHCSLHQYGAKTGRMSCSQPNLQQIPSHNKEIRKMFKASDGYVMLSADYSKQEPISLACASQDKEFIKTFLEGKDIYAQIASKAFNKPYEQCLEFNPDGSTNPAGKERRSQAKAILLGIMYGRGAGSIADQIHKSKKDAQKIIDDFYKGFKGVKKFTDETQAKAKRLGYVETIFGRKRRLPDMQLEPYEFEYLGDAGFDPITFEQIGVLTNAEKQKWIDRLDSAYGSQKEAIKRDALAMDIRITDNGGKIADAERQCLNSVIQGTAADITKRAMVLMHNDPQLTEWGFRMLVPVHDEIIAECPEENAGKVVARVAELMAEAPKERMEIPMKVDTEVTRVWYGEQYSFN